MRRGTEGSNGRPDADDVAGNLGSAAGGVLNVAGDLARRRALLLHRRRDRGSDFVDLAGGLADVPDGADRRRPDRQHAAGDGARISSVACAVWLALRASRNRRPRGRWYRFSVTVAGEPPQPSSSPCRWRLSLSGFGPDFCRLGNILRASGSPPQ